MRNEGIALRPFPIGSADRGFDFVVAFLTIDRIIPQPFQMLATVPPNMIAVRVKRRICLPSKMSRGAGCSGRPGR